jgi:hypothetical protein
MLVAFTWSLGVSSASEAVMSVAAVHTSSPAFTVRSTFPAVLGSAGAN